MVLIDSFVFIYSFYNYHCICCGPPYKFMLPCTPAPGKRRAELSPGNWNGTSCAHMSLVGAGLLQGVGMCSTPFRKPARTQNMGRDSVCHETHGIRHITPQDHTGCRAGNRPEAATRSFCRKGCSDGGKKWWMVLDKVGSHGSGETLSDFCYIFKGRGQGTASGVWERKIRSDLFPDDHIFLIAWKWDGNLTLQPVVHLWINWGINELSALIAKRGNCLW